MDQQKAMCGECLVDKILDSTNTNDLFLRAGPAARQSNMMAWGRILELGRKYRSCTVIADALKYFYSTNGVLGETNSKKFTCTRSGCDIIIQVPNEYTSSTEILLQYLVNDES